MPDDLLTQYNPAPDTFDELLDTSKAPRPHWQAILNSLITETHDTIENRVETVRRQMRENGINYNVYTDIKGKQRPWDLDVLPLILPHEEWAAIEVGVIQRATLLNQILVDVYGEQRILKEGLIPPALIHSHPGFLRPCHGIPTHEHIALHFYAVDLARAPNGRWWVINDRVEAPSGAGYALENRAVMSRIFPELLRDLNVQHLTEFFATFLDSLTFWGRQYAAHSAMPLRDNEPPLIVLLTPGQSDERYFEHAYLARHLGVTLVEGNDLTVRNGFVWFKSLSGMQRVHVIMRRVSDNLCDPLELNADSTFGVAGLTLAAKSGNVLIANNLGSNLLQSGAMLGYLPTLCERFLGEPLKMPSVATWWCGEPAAMSSVIQKLDQLIIKPSFSGSRQSPLFGNDLHGAERDLFIQKMLANPDSYLAQELVRLSEAPAWQSKTTDTTETADNNGGLIACPIGLRVFACATPSGYIVMPGGLTRLATGKDSRLIAMQRGGESKDTWVLASEKIHPPFTLVKQTITQNELIRDDTHLSSRMAESLYWFGRLAERCEGTVRLLRVALVFLSNVNPTERGSEWEAIKSLCTWLNLIEKRVKNTVENCVENGNEPQLTDEQIEAALLKAVISPNAGGLVQQLQQLFDVAGHITERLSIDNWRLLNQMMPKAVSHPDDPHWQLSQSNVMSILDDVATSLMTLSGFALDGMTRDLGWRFLSLGRRIERLQFQCRALQNALNMNINSNLNWLLELSDSIITYRTRYRSFPEWLPVLDLLVLDESNPRSIAFQIEGIQKNLEKIVLSYGTCGEEKLTPFHIELLNLNLEDDIDHNHVRLNHFLSRLSTTITMISDQVSLQFFSYTGKQVNPAEYR